MDDAKHVILEGGPTHLDGESVGAWPIDTQYLWRWDGPVRHKYVKNSDGRFVFSHTEAA